MTSETSPGVGPNVPVTGAVPGAPVARAAGRELTTAELAYVNRMTTVGQVLPNVAHEINNALQVIGGLVEMLSARAELAQDVRDKVHRIGVQAGRTAEMLRDLVAFARREYGGVRAIDVSRAIDRALSLRRYHLARARIVVGVSGAAAGSTFVRADGHHLEQVLVNLVMNAEASLAGRTDGHIAIDVEADAARVSITIRDNGSGMEPGIAAAATTPFFTTRECAAGLGLTVARLLVAADGGELVVDGSSNGCAVRLVLPRWGEPSGQAEAGPYL